MSLAIWSRTAELAQQGAKVGLGLSRKTIGYLLGKAWLNGDGGVAMGNGSGL